MSGHCKPHLNKTVINILGGNCTMKIEDIFKEAEDGTLTLEQFNEIVSNAGAKFADLSEGNYVSVGKHEAEMNSLEKQIETLTDTLNQREADVESFRAQLAEAGDAAEAVEALTARLNELQEQYNADAEAYEEQLSKQAREFAVNQYAATKEFTSDAAKQFYIEKMVSSEDVMFNKKGELVGTEDFDEEFGNSYKGSFKVAEPEPEAAPEPEQPLPKFAAPTPGAEKPASKMSLSEMMQAKNENPDMSVGF